MKLKIENGGFDNFEFKYLWSSLENISRWRHCKIYIYNAYIYFQLHIYIYNA